MPEPQNETRNDLYTQVNSMLEGADQTTPVSATVLFKVPAAREKEFICAADTLLGATKLLPGLIVFRYQKRRRVAEAPGPAAIQFLIYESWSHVADFRTQWTSAHLQQFRTSVGGFLAEGPQLAFYLGDSKGIPGEEAAAPRPGGGRENGVLKTGQAGCWDTGGNPVQGAAATGQDGDKRSGIPIPHPRFAEKDGTVIDHLTSLIWLQDANFFKDVTWDAALQNAQNLKAGVAGLTDGSKAGDWRLPNINELQSLLHLNNASGPAIADKQMFKNLVCANYWSSSSVAAAPVLGWYTALAVGPPVFDLKENTMRMWPVRRGYDPVVLQTGEKICYTTWGVPVDCAGTGQDADWRTGLPVPEERFTDRNDGTVKDELTGLIWARDANTFGTKTWQEALDACNGLEADSRGLKDGSKRGDWRLPNFNEMRSLVDYSQAAPALPVGHPFRNVRPSLYWSSTSVPSAPKLARFVFIGMGPGVWDHKNVRLNAWPVRDEK